MKIKNLLFQPLITILKNGDSLHLGPREIKTIKVGDVSDHMYAMEQKKIVKLRTNKSQKARLAVKDDKKG